MFAQGELAEMRLPPQYMFDYKYVPSKRRFLGVYVITLHVKFLGMYTYIVKNDAIPVCSGIIMAGSRL